MFSFDDRPDMQLSRDKSLGQIKDNQLDSRLRMSPSPQPKILKDSERERLIEFFKKKIKEKIERGEYSLHIFGAMEQYPTFSVVEECVDDALITLGRTGGVDDFSSPNGNDIEFLISVDKEDRE